MRVTNGMLRDGALRSLAANVTALQRIQEQVATTKRLNRPSDDPAQVRMAVKLRDGLSELEQYGRNVDTALRMMSGSDGALANAGDVVLRAREVAIQGANGSVPPVVLQEMRHEVDQLRLEVAQLAATKVGDTYVFSGFQTGTRPFASPIAAYAGDTGAIVARIGPGETLQINLPGGDLFSPVLDAINQLHDELAAGTQVSGATLALLDTAQNALLDGRTVIGARQNRLGQTQDTIEDGILGAKRLLSEMEDVDMISAISELSSRQATYEAALAVNARLLQRSLIDEL